MKGQKMVSVRYLKGDFTIVSNTSSLHTLSVKAQAIFLWLCVYADENGMCFPSRKTIATNIGMKRPDNIDPYLKELEEKLFIKITKRKQEKKKNLTNLYQILVRSIQE